MPPLPLFLAVVMVTMTSLPVVESRDNFTDFTVTTLGTTALLLCNESNEYMWGPEFLRNNSNSQPISWMMPNLTIIEGNFGDRHHMKDGNWTLEVVNVTQEDLGLYHCMLQAENVSYYLCRVGLNAEGPYFEDLWDKYWLNTVIGLSACFGFLLLAAVFILLYVFRYISPEERDRMEAKKAEAAGEQYLSAFDVKLPAVVVLEDQMTTDGGRKAASSHSGDFEMKPVVGGVTNVAYDDLELDSLTSF
jgi:hypothetical protein